MAGGAGGMAGSHHRSMPQDRPIPRMGKVGDNDCLPAGFEYDDGRTINDEYDDQLTEQELEQLALEEEDKRKKKAAKKRDKKARQKERAKKEAEIKAALAAMKKREKAIASWRSRVVAACANADGRKMDVLVGESPYKNYTYDPTSLLDDENEEEEEDQPQSQEEYLVKQMDWFLPNCLQKYSQNQSDQLSGSTAPQEQPFANNLARERLAKYIMSVSFDVILLQSPSKARNAIHSAAYHNDTDFLRWIVQNCQNQNEKKLYLESLCEDGGWTPLHYATAGGAEDVVELLLEECSVLARTDRSLTCFNRYGRRGNGITARELAIVLQSGAVDDDLTSDADILDDIVENRIDDASASDKAAYMRILRLLEERLTHVEQHGYSPPKNKLAEQQQRQDNSAASLDNEVPAGYTATSSSTNNKKSKKKKKKQQQQSTKAPAPANTAISEQESKSAPSSVSTDDDLSDPVAVALLGMGFTEDQIKSAARALGGFERATADDMVMWILGGGELADSSSADQGNDGEEDDDSDDDDEYTNPKSNSSDGAVLTKAQKKAAARAKRELEETARKHQEELAAASRAASKREEQRRIRRDWNEREQARQLDERNAKVAEAMERKRRKDMERIMPKSGGVLPASVPALPPSAVHVPIGSGKHHHHHGGPPLTIIAGGQKMPPKSNKNSAAGSNMGIPQAPTVRAPKILTRPKNNAPPGTLPSGGGGGVHPQQSTAVAGNQPLFSPALPGGSSNAKSASSSPARMNAKTYNQASGHHPSSHHQQPPPTAILQKNNVPGPRRNSRMHHAPPPPPPSDYRQHRHHPGHASSFAASNNGVYNNKDERPGPSSMGNSGTHLYQNHPGQVNSSGSVLPPGLRRNSAPEPPPTNNESLASYVEMNSMGMIRATAREYVPTSFTPLPTTTPDAPPPAASSESNNAVPSMSAQPATVSPPPPTQTTSTDNHSNLLVEPMSSLLSSFGADTSNTPPATMVPVVGNKEEVPSAASSITGFSGLPSTTMEENNATSRVGSVMTFEAASSSVGGAGGGIQTSSILESISYGGDHQNNAAGTGSSALGSGGIWGGDNNVNQTASLGLAGLNFSSFMGGDQNNNNEGNAGGSTTWGTSTGGGGSIW